MERDINVVVRIKEDGSMSFVSGDGLPLNMGGGGGHLYRHSVNVTTKDIAEDYNTGSFILQFISNNGDLVHSLQDLPKNIHLSVTGQTGLVYGTPENKLVGHAICEDSPKYALYIPFIWDTRDNTYGEYRIVEDAAEYSLTFTDTVTQLL